MSTSIYPEFPPELDDFQTSHLVTAIQDWSIAHGLAVRPPPSFVPQSLDPNSSLAVTAPVTLFPSPFPSNCFKDALNIQQSYNELYARIASDEAWLGAIVEELIGVDDFTASLWKIHQKVKAESRQQDICLGIFRSDYMVHSDPEGSSGNSNTIKQVEFNTIASSFGALSTQVSAMHAYLAKSGVYPPDQTQAIRSQKLQLSASAPSIAAGLAAAHKAYPSSSDAQSTCIIFIVQSPERNVFDQRHLEYLLLQNHDVKTFRLPFAQVLDHTSLDSNGNLMYTPPHSTSTHFEVSTIYFRAGYSPDDYNFSSAWDARLQLERSRAIKCPNILTHLAGAKKVQQVLATPSSPHLSRFIKDKTTAERLRATFAPIYPLDSSPAGLEAEKLALEPSTATNFVLKPQREGGGNNIYRARIPGFLKSIPRESWPAYILMEMINPPPLRNAILRNGEVQKGGVICELGVYGVMLWRNDIRDGKTDGIKEVLENREAGYLLRTKGDTSEEGGVAAGFGAVDSVLLC